MNVSSGCADPSISVVMAAYNAEKFILRSVQSVLAQTFTNFELLIVNDASTDSTLDVIAGIGDSRIRILTNPRNLGPVGSRNRAVQVARGRYIAVADADDLCHPTRFARQWQHFEENPGTAVLATEMSTLEASRIHRTRMAGSLDPALVEWMLHIGNPVGHPSVMFRTELLQKLGIYLREEFQYAEDFDFLHRALACGQIRILPEYLVIYRRHGANLTMTRRTEVSTRTAAILRSAYAPLLGEDDAARAAALVGRHMISAAPVADEATFAALGGILGRLAASFTMRRGLTASEADQVRTHAGRCWWQRVVLPTMREGRIPLALRGRNALPFAAYSRPAAGELARSVVSGCVPGKQRLRAALSKVAALAHGPESAPPASVGPIILEKRDVSLDDPPVLFTVVDTEAEFDWTGAFNRDHTSVTSVAAQGPAQDILMGVGVRPIYVVDYPVASQADAYEPLRTLFEAGHCVIGAHLHPWTNPPFEEEVNERNSYECNLDPDLEIRKIAELKRKIESNFGAPPLFFKAGRYGLGPNTLRGLEELGFAVDLSIMPFADFSLVGGPNFRRTRAIPYAAGRNMITLPMTRGQIGLLAPMHGRAYELIHTAPLRFLKIPGILARLGLINTITLTPEGVSADEQIALVRSMVARGDRYFVLHYHSPSLVPGNTPYVRTQADLAAFLRRIEAVSRFFVEDLGGLAGNPADLVPLARRAEVWPRRSAMPAAPQFSVASREPRGLRV